MRACVSVIDDDALVLRSLDRLLQSRGFEVHTYSSAQAFLEQHDASTPGCIVMDLSMPGLSGLELQQALAHSADRRPVVFISGRSSVEASVRAMKAGAVDFLTKPFDEADLVAAVSAALEKDRASREGLAERSAINLRLSTLTPRERDVLSRVVAGKLNKQIAAELGTAEKTVKVHRARMMRKMQFDSLAELVRAWTVTQPLPPAPPQA
ncbi:MAG TPA: response regulator [Burkholderiales bacterium]|jgi:FixJ family two-component response regulator|nr:response regulator [Burkholderiales bacterium]